MSRTSKKVAVAVVAVGLASTVVFTNIKADDIYSDSNIGITSAIDRYVESVQKDDDLLADSKNDTDKKKAVSKKDSKADADTDKSAKVDATEKASEAEASSEQEKETEATCKYPQFQDRCLAAVADSVNIRSEADENSELVGTLAANGIALVKEKGDTWTKIASGSCEGYIKNEFLVYGDEAGAYAEEHCNKLATINTETLIVRADADAESDCITMVPGGESYVVLNDTEDWINIEIDQGLTGYVSAEYVDLSFFVVRAVSVAEAEAADAAKKAAEEEQRKQAEEEQQNNSTEAPTEAPEDSNDSTEAPTETTTEAPTETPTEAPEDSQPSDDVPSSGATGVELANFALQFVGNPYVYGGTSLTDGADCSGFTLAVYAHYGISLPHSASAQANYGTEVEVSTSTLEPGDLLFYPDSDGSIGHVTIYTGDGMVVHASTEATGIKTSVYNYRTPVKAVRLLGQ